MKNYGKEIAERLEREENPYSHLGNFVGVIITVAVGIQCLAILSESLKESGL